MWPAEALRFSELTTALVYGFVSPMILRLRTTIEIRRPGLPEVLQREAKGAPNHSNIASGKIDSESPIQVGTYLRPEGRNPRVGTTPLKTDTPLRGP